MSALDTGTKPDAACALLYRREQNATHRKAFKKKKNLLGRPGCVEKERREEWDAKQW